jgi:hypothetical protein
MREYWTANFQAEFKMSMLFKKEKKASIPNNEKQ